MRTLSRLVPILACVGCAYSTHAMRAAGAPVLAPSPYAEVLKRSPPSSATLLGTVKAQGNNYQTPSSCEAQLVNEARKLGANAVLTTPASSSMGKGPSCEGTAYLIPAK